VPSSVPFFNHHGSSTAESFVRLVMHKSMVGSRPSSPSSLPPTPLSKQPPPPPPLGLLFLISRHGAHIGMFATSPFPTGCPPTFPFISENPFSSFPSCLLVVLVFRHRNVPSHYGPPPTLRWCIGIKCPSKISLFPPPLPFLSLSLVVMLFPVFLFSDDETLSQLTTADTRLTFARS